MLAFLQNFFSTAENSVKGQINPKELYLSIVASLSAATGIGILLTILQAVLTNVALIFPNPSVAALATALITLIIDLLRRQTQGTNPAPAPAPVTATVSTPVTY